MSLTLTKSIVWKNNPHFCGVIRTIVVWFHTFFKTCFLRYDISGGYSDVLLFAANFASSRDRGLRCSLFYNTTERFFIFKLVVLKQCWLNDITWGNLSDFSQLPLHPKKAFYELFHIWSSTSQILYTDFEKKLCNISACKVTASSFPL